MTIDFAKVLAGQNPLQKIEDDEDFRGDCMKCRFCGQESHGFLRGTKEHTDDCPWVEARRVNKRKL
jgi:hypothetical protein